MQTDGIYILEYMGCAVSLLVNVATCFVVMSAVGRSSNTDKFLVNIAVNNILLITGYLAVTVIELDAKTDVVSCKMTGFMSLFSKNLTIGILVLMAIDHYRHVIKNSRLSDRTILRMICSSWILAVVLAFPQLYLQEQKYMNLANSAEQQERGCDVKHGMETIMKAYTILSLLWTCGLPLVFLSVCYSMILKFVWQRTVRFRNNRVMVNPAQFMHPIGPTNAVAKRQLDILKLCITISVFDECLGLPVVIIVAIADFSPYMDARYALAQLWLDIITSMTMPIIILVCSSTFRHAVDQMTRCRMYNGRRAARVEPETASDILRPSAIIARIP